VLLSQIARPATITDQMSQQMENLFNSLWLLVSSPPIVPADLSHKTIEELGRLREGLIPYRDADITLIFWSTVMVTVGVIMEFPEIAHAVSKIVRKFRKCPDPDDLNPWWEMVVVVGWVLVAGGLALEWMGDARIDSVNSDLERIGQTITQDTQDVALSAGEAAIAAQHAAIIADSAGSKAQGTARKAAVDAKQLRGDVDEFELILSATASGHILRPVLFQLLKNEPKASISVAYFTGADATTRVFTEKLSAALAGFNWSVSHRREDHAGDSAQIFNKWFSMTTEAPPTDSIPQKGEEDWEMLQRHMEGANIGISHADAERLSILALALGARLVKDPSLDANSFRLVIGIGDRNIKR
jgi:hypothetical protein